MIRNPKFTADGLIDCEIEHTNFGWVPFTASPNDVEKFGRDVYAAALLMGPEPFDPQVVTKADLFAIAAQLRWQKETGGIDLGGMAIATDDRSKLMLSGARIAAMADPELVTRWKTPSGWVDLTAAQIIAISDAVQEHVAECFALEADVSDQIEAGTITTLEDVYNAFSAAE